jgi:prepilin-type N-terminal cleavage/methylation domain-containing protein
VREFHALAGKGIAYLKGNSCGIGHANWDFMKPYCSTRRNQGLTLLEVLVTILVLVVLMVLLGLPDLDHGSHRKAMQISCVNNLKEIELADHIWRGDHGDKYPAEVSITNGVAMESAGTGDAANYFQVMSNELSTPKLLLCPADTDHSLATNFSVGFSAKNISYFANLNASEANPQSFLIGDDNFDISGVPVKSGLLELSTNALITWSGARHRFNGNIGLTDGSVQQLTISALQQAFENSGSATNRILIP